jgi:predicted O-linked N-acetylglucosamine transferase (SPINDLY family)
MLSAPAILQAALSAMQRGEANEAERLFKRILELQPAHIGALNLFSVLLTSLRRYDEADRYLRRALSLDATSDVSFHNHGLILKALQRPNEALQQFSRALQINAACAETWNSRGSVFSDLNRYREAVADFHHAITLKADYAEALINKGKALAELESYPESLAAFDQLLKLKPSSAVAWVARGATLARMNLLDDSAAAFDRALQCDSALAEAWSGLGYVFNRRKQYDDALACYDKAVGLRPDLSEAWLGRGNVCYAQRNYEQSLASYVRALTLIPDLAEALLGCGNVFLHQRHYRQSLAACDKALALKPGLAEAWLGRGNALHELKQDEQALAAHDKAIELNQELAAAWLGRGNALSQLKRVDEALLAYDRALQLSSDLVEARLGRGTLLLKTNRIVEALSAFDSVLATKGDFAEAHSNRIFALDFLHGAGFKEHLEARNYWWREVGSKIALKSQSVYSNSLDPARRIRLGYVSGDFVQHSASTSFRVVLLGHDKSQFEVTCYSCSVVEDGVTADFRRTVDQWRDVSQHSDDELCQQIQKDQVDILVDLSGHSAGNRLTVFARKPAPIQVTAWGHATGTGLPAIDYLFADTVVCPRDVRDMFAEKIIDLPCVIPIEVLPKELASSPSPVLSNGYITFGVFNRAGKISDEALSLWARILATVDAAKILFKDGAFDERAARDRMLEKFAALGISEGRVGFLGRSSREDHLAAFGKIDISLDPFPQNGGVSTWESLQRGVPVVARLGNSMAGRLAGAIICAVGQSDWVASNDEEYVAIAKRFASMPEYLTALRHELPSRVAQSDAGDCSKYTQEVEAAYRKMWVDYCRGKQTD